VNGLRFEKTKIPGVAIAKRMISGNLLNRAFDLADEARVLCYRRKSRLLTAKF